ncbi:hypothetical protein [Nocardioides kribbensis]|uniref:hypothetical protein n=1 Tax=Nocardioides kribbensis TaxID=305517 RepID=UPI00187A7D70|nr:hypothetical protein [Nocardioides kribbensis]
MTRRPDLPRRPRQPDGDAYDPPRSLRISDETWRRIQRRASGDGLTASFVLATLARDYANFDLETPEVTKSSASSKSARISEGAWEGLKNRAAAEGLPASRVLVGLAEEYAEGLIDLHVRIVSSQQRRPSDLWGTGKR